MKQQPATKLHSASTCPVRCHECHYDSKVFPARWNRTVLDTDQSLSEMARNTNHVLFLIKGSLHIRIAQNDNHYLSSGQCIFFSRKDSPNIKGLSLSEVIWLDFSNRVIFCHRDALSYLVATWCSCRNDMPVLPIHPQIQKVLNCLYLLESPCHHMIKQYELFMHMTCCYTKEELSGFFQSILRPGDDFRAFVISNYKNMESVDDFARHAKMSKSCFIRKFRDAFGMTIHQWMMKQKEEDLCEMIRSGKKDAKELIAHLGMENSACLYQFCRRHLDCTLSELITRLTDKSQDDSSK